MRADEHKEAARQVRITHLAPDAGAGRQAQKPATVNPRRAEALAQDGCPRLCLAPLRDAGLAEQTVYPCHKRPFERLAQGYADYLWPKPVDRAVRPKDGHRPPPATEEGEKARLTIGG